MSTAHDFSATLANGEGNLTDSISRAGFVDRQYRLKVRFHPAIHRA
jgi:hypothetical protein